MAGLLQTVIVASLSWMGFPRYHKIVTVEELEREYQPLRDQALAVRRYL
jgi:hypothetical protein